MRESLFADVVDKSIGKSSRIKSTARIVCFGIFACICIFCSAQAVAFEPRFPRSAEFAEEFERQMRIFGREIMAQRDNYLLELRFAGWENVLDLERIKQDGGFKESRLMLRRTKDIVKKYKNMTDKLCYDHISECKKILYKYINNEYDRKSALKSFNEGISEAQQNYDKIWSIEFLIIIEFEKIINLLSEKNNKYEIRNGNIFFNYGSDLNVFNYHLNKISEYITARESMQNESRMEINNAFDALKQFK